MIFAIANKAMKRTDRQLDLLRDIQFWSPPSSRKYPPSFSTQTRAKASPSALSGSSIPPTIQVLTHSYKSEMAEVDEIRFVIGGKSFRTSLGSSGVRIAN